MNTRFIVLRHAIIVILSMIVLAVTAPLYAGSDEFVYSPDSVIYGRTYGEWTSAWRQWVTSMPADENPLFDTADCSAGQSGPVWFLGGRFCNTEEPDDPENPCDPTLVVRNCTIEAGKALYFPIVNVGCLDGEAEVGECSYDLDNDGEDEIAEPLITQMRENVAAFIDDTAELSVTLDDTDTLDDEELPPLLTLDNDVLQDEYRVQSTVHTVALPKKNNLYQALGSRIKPRINGTHFSVDDGIYVMLKPLPEGEYTLQFKGGFPLFEFYLDVTYHLTVE